ncbi:hypothetical protein ACA910_003840 [Epithemia clementina (nom. ined.)]
MSATDDTASHRPSKPAVKTGDNNTIASSSNQDIAESVGQTPPVVPADGLALDRINDILDFEIEHIFHDRSTRREHYECLAFFWNAHPAKGVGYGRRFVLLFLAELLVIACGRPPHDSDIPDGTPKRFQPLYALDRPRWDDLESDLAKVRVLLLRKDATVNYSSVTDTQDDASEVDLGRSKSPLFAGKFDTVVQLIQINKAIAPIRKKLEDQIDAKVGNFSSTISQSKIDEIVQHLETVNNVQVHQAVLSLFTENQTHKSPAEESVPSGNNRLSLIEDDLLANKLRSAPFDLVYFQQKFESLLHRLTYEVFRRDQSVLMGLRYTIPPDSPLDELLRTPRKIRRHVQERNDNHASAFHHDPVQGNYQTNTHASRVAIPLENAAPPSEHSRLSEKRRSGMSTKASGTSFTAPCLEIVEDLDSDDRDEHLGRARLSKHVKRARVEKIRRSTEDDEVAPDPGIFDDLGKVKRRFRWTEQEKNCVKIGVQKFGIGRWALIKKEYAQILRNRTSVQVKDCWRTMTKSGEINVPPTDYGNGLSGISDIAAQSATWAPDADGHTASV